MPENVAPVPQGRALSPPVFAYPERWQEGRNPPCRNTLHRLAARHFLLRAGADDDAL
jgi:hypothetical protein